MNKYEESGGGKKFTAYMPEKFFTQDCTKGAEYLCTTMRLFITSLDEALKYPDEVNQAWFETMYRFELSNVFPEQAMGDVVELYFADPDSIGSYDKQLAYLFELKNEILRKSADLEMLFKALPTKD